jgi:hypothetical protein
MIFEELRSFICESDRGRVFDSLIAVELGLEEYECAWNAHCDMNPHGDENDIIVAFLVDVADYIGVADSDFEKVLASVE